ncbi:MAG: hypothetical protein F4Y80_00260 [Caldilineaceae bacterium SB0665_bin_21]|nr:hypothetical protein [Caldilineaceae bacterium SB0665_bin_21]MYA04669.1 hypothetical protein [Caldilineaceae bacterium SB0664_bin_22]MYC61405.1 hypothetical protein [Caldilineaceae bacterium SB0661_bin_34]
MTNARPRRSRLWWLIPAVLAALMVPFVLLALLPVTDQDDSWFGSFYSYSETSTTYDEDGNIVEHLVNGVPVTPQPPQPDPCGNDPPSTLGDGTQGTTFSVTIGCTELFKSFEPDE